MARSRYQPYRCSTKWARAHRHRQLRRKIKLLIRTLEPDIVLLPNRKSVDMLTLADHNHHH